MATHDPQSVSKVERSLLDEVAEKRYAAIKLRAFRSRQRTEVSEERATRTRIEIEGDRFVVEREQSDSAMLGVEYESWIEGLSAVAAPIIESWDRIPDVLRSYAERLPVVHWPEVVIEIDDVPALDAVISNFEGAGFPLRARSGGAVHECALPLFGMFHVAVPPEPRLIASLGLSPRVRRVYDAERELGLPDPAPQVASDEELDSCVRMVLDRERLPKDFPSRIGEGIRIAVVDTGVDAEHPDLKARVLAAASFIEDEDERDYHGHGTHVAGTAAGDGRASDGRYAGVAPCASVLNAKVLNTYGSGTSASVLGGLHWAVSEGADVINLSLGYVGTSDGQSVESRACQRAVEMGICVMIAAGNSGPEKNTISVPADAPDALAIGAIDRERNVTSWSSRGPTDAPTQTGAKPNVVCPGDSIVAPLSTSCGREGYIPGYTVMSGTSMATPHSAGCVAALLSYCRERGLDDMRGEPLLELMAGTATALPDYRVDDQGRGLVNVAEAALTLQERSRQAAPVEHPAADEATSRRVLRALVFVAVLALAIVGWSKFRFWPLGETSSDVETEIATVLGIAGAGEYDEVQVPIGEDMGDVSQEPAIHVPSSSDGRSGEMGREGERHEGGADASAVESQIMDDQGVARASHELARELIRLGYHDAAAGVCEAILESSVDADQAARLWSLRIESLAKAGRVNEAVHAASEALDEVRSDRRGAAWIYLGCSHISDAEGDHAGAQRIRQDLVATAPDSAAARAAAKLLRPAGSGSVEEGG